MKIRSIALVLALAAAPVTALAQDSVPAPRQEQPGREGLHPHREGMEGRRGMRGRRGGERGRMGPGMRGRMGGQGMRGRMGPGMRRPGQQGMRGLIEQRQRLNLSGDQLSRLRAIEQRTETQNRALVERLRTLRENAVPGLRERRERGERQPLTEEQRTALERAREQARPLAEQMRTNLEAARREGEAVLTEQQRAELQKLREEHRGGQHGRRGAPMRRRGL